MNTIKKVAKVILAIIVLILLLPVMLLAVLFGLFIFACDKLASYIPKSVSDKLIRLCEILYMPIYYAGWLLQTVSRLLLAFSYLLMLDGTYAYNTFRSVFQKY